MTQRTSKDDLLTTRQVAEWLRLHPESVRRIVKRGELPEIRLGWRNRRYRRSDVERYLTTKR